MTTTKRSAIKLPLVDEGPRPDTAVLLPLTEYDLVIINFSGGKDSLALVLHMIEQGVQYGRMQLWHQRVDGDGPSFMDWPITEAYCEAVAARLCMPLFYQWKDGGFLGEMPPRERQDQTDVLPATERRSRPVDRRHPRQVLDPQALPAKELRPLGPLVQLLPQERRRRDHHQQRRRPSRQEAPLPDGRTPQRVHGPLQVRQDRDAPVQ